MIETPHDLWKYLEENFKDEVDADLSAGENAARLLRKYKGMAGHLQKRVDEENEANAEGYEQRRRMRTTGHG